jgi:hypothetical protein
LGFGTLFLALGGISATLAPHRFQAIREWEIWALAGLVIYSVASQWRPRWTLAALGLVYGLTGLALAHAVTVALPGSQDRLGGIFHHPNALSTFCIMGLAVTFSRALANGRDSLLAQLCSGALLGLAMGAGSLTGGAILVGVAAGLAPAQNLRWPTRAVLGLLAAALLVAANLLGGWLSVLSLPGLLMLAWSTAWLSRPRFAPASGLIVLTAGAVVLLSASLASPQSLATGSLSRQSSGLGRLEFYRHSAAMILDHPLWGVGPAGFSRNFPGRQSSVSYFSKYPHCLPLEIASEWGLPAALALCLMLAGAARQLLDKAPTPEARCAAWVAAVFFLHSTTDVQTQFPYLLILGSVALGIVAGQTQTATPRDEGLITLLTRTALAIGCLGLLVMNVIRISAGFDRALATTIAQTARTPQARAAVESLLGSSFHADPLDSESARLWGLSLLSAQQTRAAQEISGLAVRLDPQRASCLLLALTASPPPKESAVQAYQAAIELDRVNYPIFYRYLAEALKAQSQTPQPALEVLRGQAPVYDRQKLAELFSFRESDLDDQLVEFYALKAVLEEQAHHGAGEPDLRLAIHHCDGREPRLLRLRNYVANSGSVGQTSIAAKLQLLLDQMPGQKSPGPIKTPLH